MKLTTDQIARVRSLEDADRRVTPDQIVADAKDKRSPLHELFDWDKNKAAMAHWRDVAREVIGAVYIVHHHETTQVKVSAYVHEGHGRQGYRAVEAMRADPDQARESLAYTLEVASGHLRRALDLAGPLGMSDEIDALIDRIVGVQRTLKKAA